MKKVLTPLSCICPKTQLLPECPYCNQELPRLEKYYRDIYDIGVSSNNTNEWEDFVKGYDYDKELYDVLFPNGSIWYACYPNGGYMNDIHGHNASVVEGSPVKVRMSSHEVCVKAGFA